MSIWIDFWRLISNEISTLVCDLKGSASASISKEEVERSLAEGKKRPPKKATSPSVAEVCPPPPSRWGGRGRTALRHPPPRLDYLEGDIDRGTGQRATALDALMLYAPPPPPYEVAAAKNYPVQSTLDVVKGNRLLRRIWIRRSCGGVEMDEL